MCTQLVYGSKAWNLDEEAVRTLNGVNSKLLHRITGRPVQEEARDGRSFDLVRWIRTRRAQWLGHILRMEPSRMLHRAVQYMHGSRKKGDLLMDAPEYSWTELVQLAHNRDAWRALVKSIRQNSINESRWVYKSGYDTRSKATKSSSLITRKESSSSAKSSDRDSTTATIANTAAKYRARDTHEAFFRPMLKLISKPLKRKKSRKSREHSRIKKGRTQPGSIGRCTTLTTPWILPCRNYWSARTRLNQRR